MILNAIVQKLKSRSKNDFKGRQFEAWLIVQAVAWYLRYPLSYRDLEEMFLERGFEVDHSTINRWVLAYAPMIEKRLRQFRKPHCGSIRIDETYVKIRGQWKYLYRAIDKHGNPVDFLFTAKRDLSAAKRFFRKMLKDARTTKTWNRGRKHISIHNQNVHPSLYITSPNTSNKALKVTISGSKRTCRKSVVFNHSIRPGELLQVLRLCCG